VGGGFFIHSNQYQKLQDKGRPSFFKAEQLRPKLKDLKPALGTLHLRCFWGYLVVVAFFSPDSPVAGEDKHPICSTRIQARDAR